MRYFAMQNRRVGKMQKGWEPLETTINLYTLFWIKALNRAFLSDMTEICPSVSSSSPVCRCPLLPPRTYRSTPPGLLALVCPPLPA